MGAWKWVLIVLGLIAVGGIVTQLGGNDMGGLRWSTDWREATEQARDQHKLLLANFGASWCGPCKRMKKAVFASPEFAKLAGDCVLVEIDIDQNKNLASGSEVGTIPDTRLLTPEGKLVGQLVGYSDPEEFYAWFNSSRKRAGR